MKDSIRLSSLSVFFPAFDEAGNIEETVEQALLILPKIAETFEVIIVDDGSRDATLPIAQRLARKYRPQVRVISQPNKGYGGALKTGFRAAKHEWVFYSDADLQFNLAELTRFVKSAQKFKVVVGYRKNRAEGWKREFFTKALKYWNRAFLKFPVHIRDIDCAFKLIHRSVLDTITPLYADGAMISTELLLKIHRADIEVKQIGVTHYQRRIGTPTGNNLRVIFKAIIDTFMLKKYLLKHSSVGQFARYRYHRIKQWYIAS